MFPESVAAILGFLFVIAPGLVFEEIRERRRPSIDRSAFREISSVALASLAFSVVALLLIAGARALWPGLFPDFGLWLQNGLTYVTNHVLQVSIFLLTWAVFATFSAFLSARIIFREAQGNIDPHTIAWFEVFRRRRPRGTFPMALVQLEDGTEYAGEVLYYDANVLVEERELILGPPLWHRAGPAKGLTPLPAENDWKHVVVAGSRIMSMWIRYPREEVSSTPPTHGL